jgi:hypothetical protein
MDRKIDFIDSVFPNLIGVDVGKLQAMGIKKLSKSQLTNSKKSIKWGSMPPIDVLAVKQPWASLIADGIKTIEIRTRPINKSRKIAIYATLSKPEVRGFKTDPVDFPQGYVIATADLVKCKALSQSQWDLEKLNHFAPDRYFVHGKTFGWYLENIKKLVDPIPYKMPGGCVTWSKADLDL